MHGSEATDSDRRTRATEVGRYFRSESPTMDMPAYVVSGRMPGRDGEQPFETEVQAPNESVARERTYATLGGRHGHTRAQVEIEAISDEVAA